MQQIHNLEQPKFKQMNFQKKKFNLSPKFCLHNKAVILENKDGYIKFGVVNGNDFELKQRLENAAVKEQLEAEFETVNQDVFKKNYTKLFARPEKNELCISPALSEKNTENDFSENTSRETIMLLDSILNEARFIDATDIHIEENEIRFRVKGRLQQFIILEKEKILELLQRIKLLSKLDVMKKNIFQDGQFIFREENPVYVRVSIVPSVAGESVVLRLLDSKRLALRIHELGFSQWQEKRIEELEMLKNGLILICGATGSGKSTTACAMLSEIDEKFAGEKKIITIEDPCEYILKGITQINAGRNAGDFENALKYIFRQDPDVIFIGEIRDSKSAQAALQASLTGHLVFATVHTSGFAETIMRLKGLGIPLNFISQVLKGIILQNLDIETNLSGEERIVLDAKVLAINPMARDAILKGEDRVFLESTLKGLSI